MVREEVAIADVGDGDPNWLFVSGIATTESEDRTGDIVLASGIKFRGDIPLLFQHNHDKPIGEILALTPLSKGFAIKARIPKNSGLAYVDDAIKQIRSRLVKGFSIGFRALKGRPNKGKGTIFTEAEIYEVSAVTVPCNPDARILEVRSVADAIEHDRLSVALANARARLARRHTKGTRPSTAS